MGDRVVIQIKDASCGMYLHSYGSEAIKWLKLAIRAMRKGDADYSTARMIGVFHALLPGNLSLGVLPVDSDDHGDAGFVEYDCDTGVIVCRKGYLADEWSGKKIGIPPGDMIPGR